MISIQTDILRRAAEELDRQARQYDRQMQRLEQSIRWMHRQTSREWEEICRVLLKRRDELLEQKKALTLLAEGLQRICDRYDRAEQKIVDSAQVRRICIAHPIIMDLKPLRAYLQEIGLDMEEE